MPASGSWTDVVYLASSPVLDPDSAVLFGAIPITNGLAGGATYTRGLTNTIPLCADGQLYVFVVTDWRNVVNGASC
jgi:hypothetical protein